MEMKHKMLEKTDAPAINKNVVWKKPDALQWLNALGKGPEFGKFQDRCRIDCSREIL